jgi:hypothetical protein
MPRSYPKFRWQMDWSHAKSSFPNRAILRAHSDRPHGSDFKANVLVLKGHGFEPCHFGLYRPGFRRRGYSLLRHKKDSGAGSPKSKTNLTARLEAVPIQNLICTTLRHTASLTRDTHTSHQSAAGDGHAQACPVSTGRSRAGRYRVRRIVTVCRSERYSPRT